MGVAIFSTGKCIILVLGVKGITDGPVITNGGFSLADHQASVFY